MRSVLLFLFSATAAFCGPFGFGLKAGVPLTDFVNTVSSQNFAIFTSTTNPYIIGPELELRLPFGLGVELDALYRHYSLQATAVPISSRTGDWEFPLVAKYRLPGLVIHPYVEGGIAWDRLAGFEQTVAGVLPAAPVFSAPQPVKNTTTGFVLGAGIDLHLLVIHVAPEIRYTRWGAQHFLDPSGRFSSNQNQAEFLVGVTF